MKIFGKTLTPEQQRIISEWFSTNNKFDPRDLGSPSNFGEPSPFDAEQQAYLRRIQDVVERSGVTTWQQAEYLLGLEIDISTMRMLLDIKIDAILHDILVTKIENKLKTIQEHPSEDR